MMALMSKCQVDRGKIQGDTIITACAPRAEELPDQRLRTPGRLSANGTLGALVPLSTSFLFVVKPSLTRWSLPAVIWGRVLRCEG